MAKLDRKKVEVIKSAEVLDVIPTVGWEVEVESGNVLDVSFLYHIAGGRLIQKQFILFLRNQRKKRSVGNIIIRYLKFVSNNSRIINAKSLVEYKKHLDSNLEVGVNTKSQLYSAAAGFVKYLMSTDVIKHENTPKNFNRIKSSVTRSLFELAAKEISLYAKVYSQEILKIQKEQGESIEDAINLKYGIEVVNAFHTGAIKKIREWDNNCEWIDEVIYKYSQDELMIFARVTDFREKQGDWKCELIPIRTIEVAIGILYAHYGRLLPASTEWPLGVVDFLKSRKWHPSKLVASFFNNSSNLQYFLVAALTHRDIAPNVDSVAFYSYIDSFVKADEIGGVNVFLGKKRGAPVNVTLSAKDPLCEVYIKFQKRQRRILSEVPGGSGWLKKERCELFIIYSGARGEPYYLKLIDPTSTSNMVRYATKELSNDYPILKPLVNKITGKAFRSTIVAMDVIEGKSLGKINKKLNHSNLSTTMIYAERIDTQSSLESKLKKFQKFLLHSRDESMSRTGTGYLCGIKDEKEIVCKGISLCFNCEAKRLVLKDSYSISEWLAWVTKINKNEERLKFNNPERWKGYWEIKLAEYEALLSLCTRSEIDAAIELSNDIEIHLPYVD